jgi:two-component system, chemotaxis family, CheB/CheR fusion protein
VTRERADGVQAITLTGTRILVVDDEADARDLMRVLLEAEGGEVTVTGSAGEALHVIRERPIQVLIADIGMPEQDGYSLIRAVRAMTCDKRDIPAIAVTAYASVRERDLAIEAAYDWHFAKPVEPDQLVRAIVRAAAAGPRGRRGGQIEA